MDGEIPDAVIVARNHLRVALGAGCGKEAVQSILTTDGIPRSRRGSHPGSPTHTATNHSGHETSLRSALGPDCRPLRWGGPTIQRTGHLNSRLWLAEVSSTPRTRAAGAARGYGRHEASRPGPGRPERELPRLPRRV